MDSTATYKITITTETGEVFTEVTEELLQPRTNRAQITQKNRLEKLAKDKFTNWKEIDIEPITD
jgi:hypothetical protein